jgi:hypothetical protein
MAAQLSLDCPHCLTTKAGFIGTAYFPSPPGQQNDFIMLMQCQVCGEGIVAKLRTGGGDSIGAWIQGQTIRGNINLIRQWPQHIETKAPDHVPENVRRFYLQGMDSLTRKSFDAAGTMFRKSLDTGLKSLDPRKRYSATEDRQTTRSRCYYSTHEGVGASNSRAW